METVRDDDFDLGMACLRAIVEGPFVEDWEFSTIMGFSRKEARSFLVLDRASFGYEQFDAIQNAANTLAYYPHGKESQIGTLIGCDQADLESFLNRWVRHRVEGAT